MFVPFPDHMWEPVGARFIPDARNAIVHSAMEGGFDLVMQVDADQWFPWNFFLELYEGIKEHGEDTIVTGWSICKSGIFANKPSVFGYDDERGGVYAISEAQIQTSERYFPVHSFGTAGFLAPTSVFRKIDSPWFADLNTLHDDKRIHGAFVATTFTVGQDILFTARAREAGIKVLCARDARMPHETVTSL